MEKTFKTKLNAASTAAVETKATIVWDGVTAEEMQKLAAASVVINQQAIYRTSGVIPTQDTINVRQQLDSPKGGGFKATPDSLAAKAQKMDEKDYRALLTKLDLDQKSIDKMVAKKFPAQ